MYCWHYFIEYFTKFNLSSQVMENNWSLRQGAPVHHLSFDGSPISVWVTIKGTIVSIKVYIHTQISQWRVKQLDIISKHQSSFFLELVSGLSLWAARLDTLGHPNNDLKHDCDSISQQTATARNIQQLLGYTSISLACNSVLVVLNVVTDVSSASSLFLSRSSICSFRKATYRSCSASSSSRHSSMSQSASSVSLPWPSMSLNDIFLCLTAVILLKKDGICSLLKYSAGENNFC